MTSYRTVSEAISDLKNRGFDIDFNLGFDGVLSGKSKISLSPDKFEITEVHRFEGDSSSDDEAVVYAIESHDGMKGILVNGYGISANAASDQMIRQLSIKHSE